MATLERWMKKRRHDKQQQDEICRSFNLISNSWIAYLLGRLLAMQLGSAWPASAFFSYLGHRPILVLAPHGYFQSSTLSPTCRPFGSGEPRLKHNRSRGSLSCLLQLYFPSPARTGERSPPKAARKAAHGALYYPRGRHWRR